MGDFGYAMLGIVVVAVTYEIYPPAGMMLTVIALALMLLRRPNATRPRTVTR